MRAPGQRAMRMVQGETFRETWIWGNYDEENPLSEPPEGAPAAPRNGRIVEVDGDEFQYIDGVWYPFHRYDNTGYLAYMQIRPDPASSIALLTLSSPDDGLGLGGDDGTIAILVTDEQTSALHFDVGRYNLELRAGTGGDMRRLMEGPVVLSAETSR